MAGQPITKWLAPSSRPHCLPAVDARAELEAPAGAPRELVVYAPLWLPAQVPDGKDVREEPCVVSGGREQRAVAVQARLRLADAALDHPERCQHEVMDKIRDRSPGAVLEVVLEQQEAFAGVAPLLAGRPQRPERLAVGSPVRQPGRVAQHMANGDVVPDGLIELGQNGEGDVRNDRLHQGRGVDDGRVTFRANQLAVAHDRDRSPHETGSVRAASPTCRSTTASAWMDIPVGGPSR